jgi:tellurite resistance protein
MRAVSHRESDAILGAMRQVALAGGHAISHADTASILAAGHYLLRRPDLSDLGGLPAAEPADLVAILKDREVAAEAVKYLAIMVMVDGVLDTDKLARVLEYARALDVEEAYLTEMVEAASGHMAWVIADMTMRNAESVVSEPWGNRPDPAVWILPYAGDKADPALVARYEALGSLPQNTFGKALWDFDKKNRYPFPGDPAALNAAFATPHDSTHVISGYDTTYRGEILVSTFTAAMHPINPMAGHILPVVFNGHLGVKFNDVATPARGGFDPDEFWHAWARGRDMTVDIFAPDWSAWYWIERDLEELRRDWNVTPPGRGL